MSDPVHHDCEADRPVFSPLLQIGKRGLDGLDRIASAAPLPHGSDRRDRPPRLLVVDDEPNNLRVLSSWLLKFGYEIRIATDGHMALDIARNEALDLVLLDIMMPHLDGFGTCKALKDDPSTRDLPVVFLSAVNSIDHKIQAFRLGGVDYITKPFQVEEILARVDTQLTLSDQRRQLRAQNHQLQVEVEKRRHAQRETQFLLETLKEVSEASNLETALDAFLRRVCDSTEWLYGEIWLATPETPSLQFARSYRAQRFTDGPADLPALPISQRREMNGCDMRLCNTAIAIAGPAWIADLSQHAEQAGRRFCDHCDQALHAGFRSLTAIPLNETPCTNGVLLLYSQTPLNGRPPMAKLVHTATLQLRSLIGRIRSGDAMQATYHKLKHLSTVDELTQLHNRRHLRTVLKRVWGFLTETRQPLSLLVIDVDDFKRYNDHYGHLEGDHCLKIVAGVLRRAVAGKTGLAARYGGEEFVILLPNTCTEMARQIATNVQDLLRHEQVPHAKSQASDHVTVSIGIATTVPSAHTSPTDVFQDADKALYRAKNDGRNCTRIANV